MARVESLCHDGFDDDGNGKTDCEDPSCDMRSCGAACICMDLKRSEDLGSDGVENEGDTLTDCAGPDCLAKAFVVAPVSHGGQVVDCMDGVDNDLDSLVTAWIRLPGPFLHPSSNLLPMHAGQAVPMPRRCRWRVGSVLCRDGVDNDRGGPIDCAETRASQSSLTVVRAASASTGEEEVSCANLLDDHRQMDSADPDALKAPPVNAPTAAGRVCAAASAPATELQRTPPNFVASGMDEVIDQPPHGFHHAQVAATGSAC